MEELLKEMVGKKIDVNCGTAAVYRGTAEEVKNGVLRLKNEDDDVDVYIAIERIAAIYPCKDFPSRPGFVV